MAPDNRLFHHTLKISRELCRGCTHCMKRCPTQAIRIIGGKAHVDSERCIDCGQCMIACPYHAIVIEQSDFEHIYHYQHRIAIVPSLFFAQFDDTVACKDIIQAIRRIGFTDVYIAEFGIDILKALAGRVNVYADENPVISAYCPAVVRLIQIKYPSLLKHINLIRNPAQITALFLRYELEDQNIDPNEIGMFYVTPCAAKYAQILSPSAVSDGIIQGIINLNSLYNLVKTQLAKLSQNKHRLDDFHELPPISSASLVWVLAKGESEANSGRTLAIDEIHNVIEFLDLVEQEDQKNLDFLELRACDTGCTGGILTARNRFLATERLRHIAESLPEHISQQLKIRILKQADKLIRNLKVDRFQAKYSLTLDQDVATAIKKMERSQKILSALPGIDCGLCGSPTCAALAEDIVQGKANIGQCAVLKLRKETSHHALGDVWGEPQSPLSEQ
ncbi:MAG: 4Fe-4S binding protein [Spirochaetales bacterium]|nr:[Fe-Fe] hydrogenase large subunit C-terminal domain-containing protein [Sphaerochaetaceae bacterium]NLV83570.1 4Fe-4S binding protein [Spirochaetales bacterium]